AARCVLDDATGRSAQVEHVLQREAGGRVREGQRAAPAARVCGIDCIGGVGDVAPLRNVEGLTIVVFVVGNRADAARTIGGEASDGRIWVAKRRRSANEIGKAAGETGILRRNGAGLEHRIASRASL